MEGNPYPSLSRTSYCHRLRNSICRFCFCSRRWSRRWCIVRIKLIILFLKRPSSISEIIIEKMLCIFLPLQVNPSFSSSSSCVGTWETCFSSCFDFTLSTWPHLCLEKLFSLLALVEASVAQLPSGNSDAWSQLVSKVIYRCNIYLQSCSWWCKYCGGSQDHCSSS